MTPPRQLSIGLALLGASLIGTAASYGDILAYDNTHNPETNPDLSPLFKMTTGQESGDEVILDLRGLNSVPQSTWKLSSFSFQYFATSPLTWSGNETVRIRFYSLDPVTLRPYDPGTHSSAALWDSGNMHLPAPTDPSGNGVFTVTDFSQGTIPLAGGMTPIGVDDAWNPVSDIFWTASFSGLLSGSEGYTGLEIFNGPAGSEPGNNTTWYWQYYPGETDPAIKWQYNADKDQLTGATIPINFGAQFTVVPEPSTMALGFLGLAGLMGLGLKRRIARK